MNPHTHYYSFFNNVFPFSELKNKTLIAVILKVEIKCIIYEHESDTEIEG
jgi:hypothetical protein